MSTLFVETFLRVAEERKGEIALDLDASDDPLHGDQLGKFFHGYYDYHCFFPLFIFCGRLGLPTRRRPCRRGFSGIFPTARGRAGRVGGAWWARPSICPKGRTRGLW